MKPLRPPLAESILVCFAVRQEARYFVPPPETRASVVTTITGIGGVHATNAVLPQLRNPALQLVLTCGFAGALNPDWPVGTVLFSEQIGGRFTPVLSELGAVPAKFFCSPRILTKAEEKRKLRAESGADAVEMESGLIQELCAHYGIPSIVLRAVSDAAHEDLPIDFNALLDPACRLSYFKLARQAITSPKILGGLLRLGRHSSLAARRLADVLQAFITRYWCMPGG